MINLSPNSWDNLYAFDTDDFAIDFTEKLAEKSDTIVGTPSIVSIPTGFTFSNIVVSNGVVGFQLADTLGVEQTYEVKCSIVTTSNRVLHRGGQLIVKNKYE